MTIRLIAGAAIVALGLGFAASATARPAYQPGMRTMVQQGGQEHGARGYPRRDPRMMRYRSLRMKRMMRRRHGL